MAKLNLKVKKTLLKRKVDNAVVSGYYGKVITNGTVSFDEVAEESAQNTTIHKAEAKVAAELLLDGISKRIKQGYIIDLGPLGKLYPAVTGPWNEDADKLSLGDLTPKVNYKPGQDILAAVKGATLSWTDEKETDQNTVSDDNTDNTQTGGNTGGSNTGGSTGGDVEG